MKKIVNFAAAGGTVEQSRTLQAAGWSNATFCGAMGGAMPHSAGRWVEQPTGNAMNTMNTGVWSWEKHANQPPADCRNSGTLN